MSEKKKRCIFFDLGNVLLRLDHSKFGDKMKSLTGLTIERLRAVFAANSLASKYELGLLSDEEFLAGICREIGVNLRQSEFLEAWNGIFGEKPLLSEKLLLELSQRYPLWVVSNTNKMHFEFIRERYQFLTHFQGWILSYEVGAAKPDPAIFSHALGRAQVAASEVLFIDDQPANVESARSLGMDAFQFLNPTQLKQEFKMRHILL